MWMFLTVFINFMPNCVISCWGQIGTGGVAWSGGGRSLWDSQTTTTSTSTLGVGEGNTEKGWKAAKIDDPNKIFNNSLICCTFIKFKRKNLRYVGRFPLVYAVS